MGSKKSTRTEHTETQRTNPDWVTSALQGYTGKAAGLLDRDPNDFVAPANPLQTQAGEAAAGLGGWRGAMDQAQAMTAAAGRGAGSSSLLSNLQDYINPNIDSVVATSLQGYDDAAGQKAAQMAAAGARNRAFGGSRYGVAEGQAAADALRGRAALEAGLRSDAFNTGAQLSNLDAGRRQETELANQQASLQSAGLMGQIASMFGSNQRADIAAQMDVGGGLRDVDNQQRQAETGLLGTIGNLLGQGQFDLYSGQIQDGTAKTKESGGLIGNIGGLLSAATGAMKAGAALGLSDAQLKRDVQTLGHDDHGRRWVSWRYLWDADDVPPHVGVIAQEIVEIDPDAVIEGPMGFLAVDYSKLEAPTWLHS